MEFSLDWDEMKETVEVEFLGIAVYVNYPCECPLCKEGREKLEEMGRTVGKPRQLHIAVVALDQDWDLQHIFVDMNAEGKVSRRGVWAHASRLVGIPAKNFKAFAEFLKNNVLVYKKTTVGEYLEKVTGIVVRRRDLFQRAMEAQVTVPTKLIPKDAWVYYEINEEKVAEAKEEGIKMLKEDFRRKGVPNPEQLLKMLENQDRKKKTSKKTKGKKKEEDEEELVEI